MHAQPRKRNAPEENSANQRDPATVLIASPRITRGLVKLKDFNYL